MPSLPALSNLEERESKRPTARKALEDRTVYISSQFPTGDGLPLLSDFGEARFFEGEHNDDIMPDYYRAPEVIFKSHWDFKVDIWSVGMVVSESLLLYQTSTTKRLICVLQGLGHCQLSYFNSRPR